MAAVCSLMDEVGGHYQGLFVSMQQPDSVGQVLTQFNEIQAEFEWQCVAIVSICMFNVYHYFGNLMDEN